MWSRRAGAGGGPGGPGGLVEAVVVWSALCLMVAALADDQTLSDRFAVYWNRSNPR